MTENTKIEWARHTFNAWIGCTKVSPGCDHCYAERQDGHRRWTPEGWGGPRRRTGTEYWKQPLKWDRAAAKRGERHRVFCSSLADVFDNQVDEGWRADLWTLIAATPNLDWLLLTKRPQNIKKMLPADWGDGYPNVWLGTTVEDQTEANRRISHLLAVPAKVHFLSCEPLLGPVNLTFVADGLRGGCFNAFTGEYGAWLNDTGDVSPPSQFPGKVSWVICGGESGPGARPMHPDWARSLRDQSAAADVAFHFKQWGEWSPAGPAYPDEIEATVDQRDAWEHAIIDLPSNNSGRVCCMNREGDMPVDYRYGGEYQPRSGAWWLERVGKKAAGRLLDGIQHDGVPS